MQSTVNTITDQDTTDDAVNDENETGPVLDLVPAEDEKITLGETFNNIDGNLQTTHITANSTAQSTINEEVPVPSSNSLSTPNTQQQSESCNQGYNTVHTCQKSPPTQQKQYKLKSKLGKAVAVVLGQTPAVEIFDQKHCELKEKLKKRSQQTAVSNQEKECCKDTLAIIQVKVLETKSNSEKELKRVSQ